MNRRNLEHSLTFCYSPRSLGPSARGSGWRCAQSASASASGAPHANVLLLTGVVHRHYPYRLLDPVGSLEEAVLAGASGSHRSL